jgi:ATP-dependent DNA helicase RecQ
LRTRFPSQSFAAFTASATRRVRHDIIEQLKMREPHKYIASFHRPNLRYIVKQCEGRTQAELLVTALRQYAGSNVIVYAPTIAIVEQTVGLLAEYGISAVAYHGRMDADTRRIHQERWMSDEVPVLVGTLAFGLGINKASVRAVIHLSLPKSVEQYYQEAGRAGRDGQPADCLLLWQKRDAALLAHFIKELNDPAETARAWQRYHEIRDFAESTICRHRRICSHFGESTKWQSCTACDLCIGAPPWLSPALGTRDKRKPARRAARPTRQAPEPDSRPIRAEVFHVTRREVTSSVPSQVSPRGLGYRRASGPAASSSVMGPAMAALDSPAASKIDSELREYLREWRRNTATQQGVPAFIVMYDSTLEELCRVLPRTLTEVRRISGFGERKTEAYGQQIIDALQRFRNGERASKYEPKVKGSRRKRSWPAS